MYFSEYVHSRNCKWENQVNNMYVYVCISEQYVHVCEEVTENGVYTCDSVCVFFLTYY